MKTFLTAALVFLAAASLLAGCDSNPTTKGDAADAPKPEQAAPAPAPAVSVPAPEDASKEAKPADPVEKIREAKTTTDLQRILTELGYKPGAVDGIRGKKTIDALKKFQHDHDLPPTGILDPDTVHLLETTKP